MSIWDWQKSWRLSSSLTELPNTKPKGDFGRFGLALFVNKAYPACSKHGAMAKVSEFRSWWRCLTCHIGCEWKIEEESYRILN
jgi:hypothetical protein